MEQLSFFDAEKRYEKLTELGDPLEKLNKVMDWEMFREKLIAVCQKEDYTKGGRPPIDVIIKFKYLLFYFSQFGVVGVSLCQALYHVGSLSARPHDTKLAGRVSAPAELISF